ncbi:glyoxal oxidase N-terminus-domain-containing protein [Mycena maculata]|uniref:Glyoxal oxidase N-terminus-domain-containing protein n=1 Tax=Mycena maculata TaxID=230809 RepID=A0AAD7JNJ0_9AGAR|nr:glyoxal oxidase N-terminus-domain-containing protein [Mycena maculata]
MRNLLSFLLVLSAVDAQRTTQWTFVQNGTSGIIPVELITISPTLMLMYDRADGNPLLLPNGERAWAALWNLETNTPTPLSTITDTFCAGGGFISNGTLVSVAGQPLENPGQPPADGRMGIRLFGPCTSPSGENCTVFEDPENIHLAVTRWYPTGLRIPDGSLMVIGGANINTFYNTGPTVEDSIEFFPSRPGEEGMVRSSQFLLDAEPVNMFPRSFVLPSGHVFVIANNITMIYDVETNTETRLPDIPNGIRIANPFDGTAQLLPLSPPLYEPTVLVCGGSAADDTRPVTNLTTEDPATNQCSRITLTPAGTAIGWEVERMPEVRILMESVMLPTGDVLLINGAHTGYSGYPSVSGSNATGSNAANPAFRGILYRTEFPAGQRITQEGLPTSNIARMYHSAASLTAKGNVMVAGSNPHPAVVLPPTTLQFPTEFRVQYLNPDFITNNDPRPVIQSSPTQISFNQKATFKVAIPPSLLIGDIKVSLMDLGYVTHAQHSNSRLVFLEHTLLGNNLEVTAPPNNNIYPPGPAWLFLVADGVHSEGVQVMVGDGGDPPRADQGIKIPINSL